MFCAFDQRFERRRNICVGNTIKGGRSMISAVSRASKHGRSIFKNYMPASGNYSVLIWDIIDKFPCCGSVHDLNIKSEGFLTVIILRLSVHYSPSQFYALLHHFVTYCRLIQRSPLQRENYAEDLRLCAEITPVRNLTGQISLLRTNLIPCRLILLPLAGIEDSCLRRQLPWI